MCRGTIRDKSDCSLSLFHTLPYVSEIGVISSLEFDSYSKIYLLNTHDTTVE